MPSRARCALLRHLLTSLALLPVPALATSAQSASVRLAEGSGVQPPYMVDTASAWAATQMRPSTCAEKMPAAGMSPVRVFLDARMVEGSSAALTSQADLIAQNVAASLRRQLGGTDAAVPQIGDAIKWFAVPAEIVIVARPNGELSWHGASESGSAEAVNLLALALDSARRDGTAMLVWPEGYAGDSVEMRLSLLPETFREEARPASAPAKRLRFLAFTMLRPKMSHAHSTREDMHIKYPHFTNPHTIKGQLITEFVVDTSGRAVMSTFKDVWPSNQAPLPPSLRGYYDQFVKAVRDGISEEQFTPAHFGSCAMAETMHFHMNFAGHAGQGADGPYSP